MKYIIIGDIHGRTNWEQLVSDDAIVIFVGDYFSPYQEIPFTQLQENFLKICQYKKDHPKTVLLIGNHDLSEGNFWYESGISRHDYKNHQAIEKLFKDNIELFQVAYSINNQILVTHAGVGAPWYIRHVYLDRKWVVPMDFSKFTGVNSLDELSKSEEFNQNLDSYIWLYNKKWFMWNGNQYIELNDTPDTIAENINKIWFNEDYSAFSFAENCTLDDCYGDSYPQSPMWIRLSSLATFDIFKYQPQYKQVFGHTIAKDIVYIPNKADAHLIMIDCLEKQDKAYLEII